MERPEVRDRAVRSFFADLHAEGGGVRACRGTSCALTAPAATDLEHGVYCLGYCDRSPAILFPDGRVATGSAAREGRPPSGPPPPPSIRCLAPEPLVTRRVARGDFSQLESARGAGAYRPLERALRGTPEAVLAAVERSGERGRGGAGYATGAKWRACAEAPGDRRYVIANGDEGDPGSFVDRVLMEADPHAVLEGMLLCGYAVGASEGIVFIRSEYPQAAAHVEAAIAAARQAGLVGPSVLGSAFAFEISVARGMGSYVCGEETALLNALEGRRGEVRLRPPYPAERGLHGRPTVVNNVETLANAPVILERGAESYAKLGTAACSGTKALCLNRGFARPGIVEVEFGTPLGRVIEEAGGGAGGARLEAVLLGGPMGSVVPPDQWDVPVCYSAMAERGIQLGHGGLVALPEGTDLRALLVHWLRFMRDESCGKCTPCRLGSARALALARSLPGEGLRDPLLRLLDVMEAASLCAFGQLMPAPLRQLIDAFGERLFTGEQA